MIADHRPIVRSPLALRLVAAFVAVAVAAVFVLAGLTLWRTRHTVGRLADERQQATADAIAQTLALGYQQDGGWDGTDPHPAMMVAVQAGASLTVLDAQGSPLLLRSRMGNLPVIGTVVDGVARRAPVVADGRPVGTAVVTVDRKFHQTVNPKRTGCRSSEHRVLKFVPLQVVPLIEKLR